MSQHDDIQLGDYLDGRLRGDARGLVEDSLDRDAGRRDELHRLRRTGRLLSDLSRPSAAPDTREFVLAAIEERGLVIEPVPSWSPRQRPVRVGLLGGALLAAAVLFVVVLPSADPEAGPDQIASGENPPPGSSPAEPLVPVSPTEPAAPTVARVDAAQAPVAVPAEPPGIIPVELAGLRRDLLDRGRVVRIVVAPRADGGFDLERLERLVRETGRRDPRYGKLGDVTHPLGPVFGLLGDRGEVDRLLARLRAEYGSMAVQIDVPPEAVALALRDAAGKAVGVGEGLKTLPRVERAELLHTEKTADELNGPPRPGPAGARPAPSQEPVAAPGEASAVYLVVGPPATP